MRRLLAISGVASLLLVSAAGVSSVSAQETETASLSVTCTVGDGSTAACSLSSDQQVGDGGTVTFHYTGSDGEPVSTEVAASDLRVSFVCSDSSYCYSFNFELADSGVSSLQVSGPTLVGGSTVLSAVVPSDDDQQTTTTTTTTVPADQVQETQDSAPVPALGYPCPQQPTLTCADLPTENVVILNVNSESATVTDSDGSTSTHEWKTLPSDPPEADKEFVSEVIETSTATEGSPPPMVVVYYPVKPSDPDQWNKFLAAHKAAKDLGRPFLLCLPSTIEASTGEVYTYADEDCVVST